LLGDAAAYVCITEDSAALLTN